MSQKKEEMERLFITMNEKSIVLKAVQESIAELQSDRDKQEVSSYEYKHMNHDSNVNVNVHTPQHYYCTKYCMRQNYANCASVKYLNVDVYV